MKVYRVTSAAVAAAILADGFKDLTRRPRFADARKGVWLSDRPLHAYVDIWSDTILAVEFECPESELDQFELVEAGNTFREWFIPADFINAHGKITIVEVSYDEDYWSDGPTPA